MKKFLLLISGIAALCLSAVGQTPVGFIPVSAAKLFDSTGVIITNAQLCGQLIANSATGISVELSGGGHTTSAPVCTQVINGAFSINLPDVSTTQPQNACISITVVDNLTGTQLLGPGYSCVQPTSTVSNWCTGTVCKFDLYPPYLPNLSLIPVGSVAVVANSFKGAWSLNAMYNSGDIVFSAGSLYMCSFNGNTAFGPFGTNVGPGTQWTLFLPGIVGPAGPTGPTGPAGTTATSSTQGSVVLPSGQTSNVLSTIAITGNYSDLRGLPTIPTPVLFKTNGTATPNQGVVNMVAGSGITITTSADGTILLTVANGGGSGAASPLPTVPSSAFFWTNLQQQSSTCPSSTTPGTFNAADNCWVSDTIDATAAAGAGYVGQTTLKFGVTSPSLSAGGAMMAAVANPAAPATTVANSLYYRHLSCATAPTVGSPVTTGTLTVSPGTVTLTGTSVSFANMTATDTTYAITAMQVYVDNTLVYTNGTGAAPFTPASYTATGLTSGTHSLAVKAFDQFGTSSVVLITVTIGGAPCSTLSNALEDNYYYIPSGNTLMAFEFDPDLFQGTFQYVASMQCDVDPSSAAPGQWRFWQSFAGTNASTGVPYGTWLTKPGSSYSCTAAQATNQWHHYQLYITYNQTNNTYSYQTFVIDGVVVFQNLNYTFAASPNHAVASIFTIQHQIDNMQSTSRTTPGNTIYYDQYNLSVW